MSSALTVSISKCNRLTPKKYSPTTSANSAQNQSFGQATYRPVQSPVHFKPPYRPSKDTTHSGQHSTSSNVSGGGAPSNGTCNLTTGAVATKIQRVKQWRYQNQNQPLPATPEKNAPARNQLKQDLSPLGKMTAYLSSSTQDMSLDSLLSGEGKKKSKHNTGKLVFSTPHVTKLFLRQQTKRRTAKLNDPYLTLMKVPTPPVRESWPLPCRLPWLTPPWLTIRGSW